MTTKTAPSSRAAAGAGAGSAPSSSATAASASRPPVKRFRFGRVEAAVWENPSEKGPYLSVTFSRFYVDEAKQYHDTASFHRDDLLLVAKLADAAHTFVCEQAAESRRPAPAG